MTVTRSCSRTVAVVFAAAAAALLLSAPASAGPAVDDPEAPVPVCADVEAPARSLRAAGFSSQAVKDYTELTRQDCNA